MGKNVVTNRFLNHLGAHLRGYEIKTLAQMVDGFLKDHPTATHAQIFGALTKDTSRMRDVPFKEERELPPLHER
jgi:hypothetical protein